jgi:hypothetical protein
MKNNDGVAEPTIEHQVVNVNILKSLFTFATFAFSVNVIPFRDFKREECISVKTYQFFFFQKSI